MRAGDAMGDVSFFVEGISFRPTSFGSRSQTRQSLMSSTKKETSPICIAGAHRSGTSMVMRLLHECGLYLGAESDLMPAQADNPDGFWEPGFCRT